MNGEKLRAVIGAIARHARRVLSEECMQPDDKADAQAILDACDTFLSDPVPGGEREQGIGVQGYEQAVRTIASFGQCSHSQTSVTVRHDLMRDTVITSCLLCGATLPNAAPLPPPPEGEIPEEILLLFDPYFQAIRSGKSQYGMGSEYHALLDAIRAALSERERERDELWKRLKQNSEQFRHIAELRRVEQGELAALRKSREELAAQRLTMIVTIADDSYAMTFQALRQYRNALLTRILGTDTTSKETDR